MIIVIVMIVGGIAELIWENTTVGVTRYTVVSEKIPAAFDGYKILLLADIQGTDFGERLYRKIEKEQADLAVFAGDLADENVAGSEKVISRLLESGCLPQEIYAVAGNHDIASPDYKEWKNNWESISNFRMLENSSVTLKRGEDTIALHGITDPGYWEPYYAERIVQEYREELTVPDGYNMLLFHRANMLDMFADDAFDLVMAGHLHGGQVRIPFLGGLRSPHNEWFPDYDGGQYRVSGRDFIVTRGIGNPVIVPRVLNRGELVVITLQTVTT